MKSGQGLRNALTVDVEEYFQVCAFEGVIAPEEWENWPSRLEPVMQRLLDLLAQREVKATFFVLGWVAERHPRLIQRLVAEGHELASHGYAHVRADRQSPELFFKDVLRTRLLLEDLGGVAVVGYRASTYSIHRGNLWALQRLREAGYRYSSSIYPIHHDLYGMPDAPRFPFRRTPDSVIEIPVTTLEWAGRRFPCGGGGFFRLYPYFLSRWALRRINREEGRSALFYCHPWEFDPEQPRPAGLGWKGRFRHYLNLRRTWPRFERLVGDFSWDRMDRVFAEAIGEGEM
ncbi:MAG: DUF3473 domain-containing protein [Magnetococcales bacterium]|nr:DUF3473 domain-containing protein [Magnetococcales bacterium]